MYFKLFSGKLPQCLRDPQPHTLKIKELYYKLKRIYNEFVNEANKFYLKTKSYGFDNEFERLRFNQYKQMHAAFRNFMQICIHIIDVYNCDINAYFCYEKYKPMSHGSFFVYKKLFNNLVFKKVIDWRNYFNKSTRPKTIEYKYPLWVQKRVCDTYFSYDPKDLNKFMNFTTFWQMLRHKEMLSDIADFSSISDSTLRKILSKDKRYKPRRKSPTKDHPFRNKPKPSGHAQMDIKVFGRDQTGCHRYVYSFDCIETQTRIPYSKILERADTKHAMDVIEEAKLFYESFGIKLTLIRTDNAMMFKETNFVTSNEFNDFCRKNNIIHQFTPLGEPEANGCVERYHRTLDHELVPKLQTLTNKQQMNECFKKYQHWYIYERYMYFGELTDKPRQDRYMKPIQAIEYFKKYNTNN